MTEGREIQEQIKLEVEGASQKLLSGIVDVQDSLALIVEGSKDVDQGERDAIGNAADALRSFFESNPKLMTANPRSISEKDRSRILPGQHGGVYLQFSLEDGSILGLNFYGGLRTLTELDLKDRDISQRTSHVKRTHEIASQRTHLNWQISYPGSVGLTIDSWLVYTPGGEESFKQSKLFINRESIDVIPNFNTKGYKFSEIKEEVFEPIRKLTKLIPSSV